VRGMLEGRAECCPGCGACGLLPLAAPDVKEYSDLAGVTACGGTEVATLAVSDEGELSWARERRAKGSRGAGSSLRAPFGDAILLR